MSQNLKVWVDHALCVGNGTCLTIAPHVFRHNAKRQSEAVNPAGDSAEAILHAARNCPIGAIQVEDADTGKRLFP